MNRNTMPECKHHVPLDSECRQCASSRPRLSDDEIGRLWFELALPGVTETAARRIVRAAEQRLFGVERIAA